MLPKIRPYLVIVAALAIAYLPVLLGVYIRQDDMEYYSWIGMAASNRFDYFNTVFELFRPLSMPLIIFADGMAYNVTAAVWVRLLSILCLVSIAWLVYRWQLRFAAKPYFACAFAISAFALPAYQVFVATANYFCILVALLIAILASEGLWLALGARVKRPLLLFSFILYLVSLMTYQLSAMFSWTMLGIAFLQYVGPARAADEPRSHRRRLVLVAASLVTAMLAYFVAGNVVLSLVSHAGPEGRHLAIDLHFWSKLRHLWLTAVWHSRLWFWQGTGAEPYSFLSIVVLFCIALWARLHGTPSWPLLAAEALALVAAAFVVAYAPVLAPRDFQVSFRYAIATMPLLLYVVFWSANEISIRLADTRFSMFVLSVTAIFGVIYCNLMLERYIVGPQDLTLAYVRHRLESDALPAIKAGKKVTVAIKCNFAPPSIYGYVAPHFEYGMRIWQYQEQCVSAVVHGLRMLGVESTLPPPEAMVHKYSAHSHIVSVHWGRIIATDGGISRRDLAAIIDGPVEGPLVSIDPRNAGNYRPFSLYSHLFSRAERRVSLIGQMQAARPTLRIDASN